jgi:hypothetical protein
MNTRLEQGAYYFLFYDALRSQETKVVSQDVLGKQAKENVTSSLAA